MTTATFDPERLLRWKVPEATHEVRPRDTAFYALSVGLGRDPLDEWALRFVDPSRRDFSALPSYALVLGYPGFWLGDPATGVDAASVLHIEQSIEILAPLPVSGRVTGVTEITGIADLGPGRSAILYSTRSILGGDGRNVAHISQAHMLRGYGGFGGSADRPPSPPPLPDHAPAWRKEFATEPDQALLYRLNGDLNPIHADPAFAARAGYNRPVLHGMCTFAIATHVLLRTLSSENPGDICRISMRFTAPVTPGEHLTIDIHDNGSFRMSEKTTNRVVADRGYVELSPS